MIDRNKFHILADDEKAQYLFEHCELCCFYESCELINDYVAQKLEGSLPGAPVVYDKVIRREKGKARPTIVTEPLKPIVGKKTLEDLPFYVRDIWHNGRCPMNAHHPIECGDAKWVADGIGDHFKIETIYNYNKNQYVIDKSSRKRGYQTHKWEPCQPVCILAPTGKGKNHFIEHDLLEYVRRLNHKNKTEQRVLILSNRIALRMQTKDRLENGVEEDSDIYYGYKEYADVMSYQSLLRKVEYLRHVQKRKDSGYLFVICDEAHFFTSDAMFNPETERILDAIVNIFSNAIRVYMTATPYECLEFIARREYKREKPIPAVVYHFGRDYQYLDVKYFTDENTELKDIITKSINSNNEKWLIFIDNKKQGNDFKNLLEHNGDEASSLKGKVMAIDANSKYNDKRYQEMIVSEAFCKGINVVITTSVIDNGVNFRNIENIVVTDINQTKCLQMVGRVRVDRDSETNAALSRVTLFLKRHDEHYLSRRLKSARTQMDAYHDFDMLLKSKADEWSFLDKYYDNDQDDWENAKHWFGRDKKNPTQLYPNEIARALLSKHEQVYASILTEMEEIKNEGLAGQKYLEYQLSWFGKEYCEEHDITLNGYKTDDQLAFEEWLREEWLGKSISPESQKDFGQAFFAQYYPSFGLCTKKQGFSSDDNRGENGPKTAGYSIKRIKEIFHVRKMPFELIDNDGCWMVSATEGD